MDSPINIWSDAPEGGKVARLARSGQCRWVGATLAVILLAAAGLRFNGLDREGRWGDEYLQTMQYDLPPSLWLHGARVNNQPPLDFIIGWAVTKVARTTWMMRAPAAFFGVCGVGVVFLLGRRLFGARVGLLAAGLLAVTPLHWKLSQEARPYALLAFSVVVTLWLLARALDRPAWRRVLVYATAAYLMTLTRGLAPLVVMLTIGGVLSVVWWRERRTEWSRGVGRVLAASIAVGLAAVPMLAYLLRGDHGWTVFGETEPAAHSALGAAWSRLIENAAIWAQAATPLFGPSGWLIGLLALSGIGLAVGRWRLWSWGGRCVLTVMVLVGPVYLLVFSATVGSVPINPRYALFLAPLAAVMAAYAALAAADALRGHAGERHRVLGSLSLVVALSVVVGLPAASTWALTGAYFLPDWRGTAAYLGSRLDGDDVVMVFADKPLGAGQPPYWGKLDWPSRGERPLGESVWVLATSEPHWRRLLKASGRCCVVIKYFVGEQKEAEYLQLGLQDAVPPVRLTKFRGLDVLEGFERPGRDPVESSDDPPLGMDLPHQVVAACDYLLALPRAHTDAAAMLYLLRSRMLLHLGEVASAQSSYEQACASTPRNRQSWFFRLTAVHRQALDRAKPGRATP